jgi:cell shape-determining protein MreD
MHTWLLLPIASVMSMVCHVTINRYASSGGGVDCHLIIWIALCLGVARHETSFEVRLRWGLLGGMIWGFTQDLFSVSVIGPSMFSMVVVGIFACTLGQSMRFWGAVFEKMILCFLTGLGMLACFLSHVVFGNVPFFAFHWGSFVMSLALSSLVLMGVLGLVNRERL